MTSSIESPQGDGQILESEAIATRDHLDMCMTVEAQSGDDESTKAFTPEPSSSDGSSMLHCSGEGTEVGELPDAALATAQITVVKGARSSTAKQFVPTKAPPRARMKRRFQPYPRRGYRGSAVTPLRLKRRSPLSSDVLSQTSSRSDTSTKHDVVV